MARTPSLDRSEAESMLGPRGHSTVNIDNRSLVRKWLVSCGVPASVVGGLTMSTLANAYNDQTDNFLNTLLHSGPEEAPRVETPAAPAANNTQAMAAAIATALAGFNQGGMNADQVRQIIRDELPDLIPVTRLEIVQNGEIREFPEAPRHKLFG